MACVALLLTKRNVLIIDCDNENSALFWFESLEVKPERLKVERASADGLAKQALEAKTRGDVVLIDCPANNREMLHRAASIADHVLVPVKPTGIDIDRLRSTLTLLADVDATRRAMGNGLDVAILFTHWKGRRRLESEALEALNGFPVLSTKIRSLKAYEEAFSSLPDYLEEYKAVWKELGLKK